MNKFFQKENKKLTLVWHNKEVVLLDLSGLIILRKDYESVDKSFRLSEVMRHNEIGRSIFPGPFEFDE